MFNSDYEESNDLTFNLNKIPSESFFNYELFEEANHLNNEVEILLNQRNFLQILWLLEERYSLVIFELIIVLEKQEFY